LYAPPRHEIIAKKIHPKVASKDVQYVHPRHGRSMSSGECVNRRGSARASSEERNDGVMPRVASSNSNISRTSTTESAASINGRRTPERLPVDASLPLRNSLNRNFGLSGSDSRNSLNSKRFSGGSIERTSSDPSPERPGLHSVGGRKKPMKVSISPERSGQPSNKGVPVEQD
jgi:hypothetical protein